MNRQQRKWKWFSAAQLMVILSLAIVALLAVCTLGVDMFHVYWQKNRLQAATDAAALGGATYLNDAKLSGSNPLCQYKTVGENAACSYALANGIAPAEIDAIAIGSDKKSVRVTTSRIVPAVFARVIGYSQFLVHAAATAVLKPLSSSAEVLPVGLDARTAYQYGQEITIHYHDYAEGDCGAGCWQGLSLPSHTKGSTGGSAYLDNLENGCNCRLSVGDSVTNEPGAKTGPTQQGIDQRILTANANYPGDSWDSHVLANPRAVALPLVQWTGCGGRCTGGAGVVAGFAEVWLVSATSSSINVIFIRQADTGDYGGDGGTDTGAVHPTLVE